MFHRRRRTIALSAVAVISMGLAVGVGPASADQPPAVAVPSGQLPLTGNISVHDPTMAYDEAAGLYVVAATGNSIRTAPTKNGPWTVRGNVTRAPWTTQVPNSTTLWAPHLEKIGDTFYYYYAQSSFGSQTSAIGLKTTTTPADPASYVDLGRPVVTSGALAQGSQPVDYNAIDPDLVQDGDGHWWLVWGSFWDGIVVQQLDADLTGVVGEPTLVASRQFANNPIEGPAIFFRDGYYYLVVSWDTCCAAAASTYKVAVGRSTSVTGPYVDQAGVRLDQGGGTVILDSRQSAPGVTPAGLYRAPGGADVYSEGGVDYLVYHAYLPTNTLGIRPMDWRDGWPFFDEPGGGAYDLADGSHIRLVSEAKPFQTPDIGRVAGPAGFGTGMRLNGGTPVGYVDMPDGIVSGLDGDFTISMWVNRATTSGQDWTRLFDFGDDTGNFMFLSPATAAAPTGLRLDLVTRDDGSQSIPGSGNSVSVPTGWRHIAVTLSGTTGSLWVNGALVRSNANFTLHPADLGFTVNNWLGRSQFAADPWLNGSIDDVNIFGRALSADEIQALTTAPGGGDAVGGGDVAWYRFDEPGGPTVTDSSGSANDAVAVVPITTEAQLQNPTRGTQCLGVDPGTGQVVQATCADGDDDQTWRLDETSGGFYQLASHASDERSCLAIADASGVPGTPARLVGCDSSDQLQQWFVADTGQGFQRFVSRAANLAIEIENQDGVIGTAVVGEPRRDPPIANLWPPQQWLLEHVDRPSLTGVLMAVDELDPAGFTRETWGPLDEARSAAVAVAGSSSATTEDVVAALVALERARDALASSVTGVTVTAETVAFPVGATIDPAGLSVRARHADGTEGQLGAGDYTLTGLSTSVPGDHLVTVTVREGLMAPGAGPVTASVSIAVAPAWDARTVYDTGDRVYREGSVWLASWWTRNQVPGDPWGPWQEIRTAPDGTAIWTASRIFVAGDVVAHDGVRYAAQWWTRNQVPGDPYGPWRRLA